MSSAVVYPQSEMERFCKGCPCFKMDGNSYSEEPTCNHDKTCKMVIPHVVGVMLTTQR